MSFLFNLHQASSTRRSNQILENGTSAPSVRILPSIDASKLLEHFIQSSSWNMFILYKKEKGDIGNFEQQERTIPSKCFISYFLRRKKALLEIFNKSKKLKGNFFRNVIKIYLLPPPFERTTKGNFLKIICIFSWLELLWK